MVSLSGGIQVADECISEFVALRMKRAHRYMILKVNDDKTSIVLEHVGSRESTFEQFKEQLPKDGGRYVSISFPNISFYYCLHTILYHHFLDMVSSSLSTLLLMEESNQRLCWSCTPLTPPLPRKSSSTLPPRTRSRRSCPHSTRRSKLMTGLTSMRRHSLSTSSIEWVYATPTLAALS